MRKIAFLCAVLMLAAMVVGCGTNLSPVSGISEEQAELLAEFGIPEDQLENMSEEEIQAILAELEYAAQAEAEKEEQEQEAASKKYTTADVAAGGKYVVRIGDGRLNNYYLYFEDGKLVKVEISFQKNDGEEPETYLFEGDNLEEFWHYGMTLDELIAYFDDQGYGYTTDIRPME